MGGGEARGEARASVGHVAQTEVWEPRVWVWASSHSSAGGALAGAGDGSG